MENAVVSAVNRLLAENGYDFLECFVELKTESVWDELAGGRVRFDADGDNELVRGLGLVAFCLREKNRV